MLSWHFSLLQSGSFIPGFTAAGLLMKTAALSLGWQLSGEIQLCVKQPVALVTVVSFSPALEWFLGSPGNTWRGSVSAVAYSIVPL